MRLWLAACAVGLSASEASAQILGSPQIYPASGHTYFLLEASSWTFAQAQAEALGGDLVTVNTSAENTWLFNTFSAGSQRLLWLGLSDAASEGMFAWSSGESFGYTNWAGGEPNNAGSGEDYVHMSGNNFGVDGRWNDAPNWNGAVPGHPYTVHGVVEVAPAADVFFDTGVLEITGSSFYEQESESADVSGVIVPAVAAVGGGTSSGPVRASMHFAAHTANTPGGILLLCNGTGEAAHEGVGDGFASLTLTADLEFVLLSDYQFEVLPGSEPFVSITPVLGEIDGDRISEGVYIVSLSDFIDVFAPGTSATSTLFWGLRFTEICLADFDGVEGVDSGDFFAFISAFIAGDADVNDDFVTDSSDFFDFIAAFLAGC